MRRVLRPSVSAQGSLCSPRAWQRRRSYKGRRGGQGGRQEKVRGVQKGGEDAHDPAWCAAGWYQGVGASALRSRQARTPPLKCLLSLHGALRAHLGRITQKIVYGADRRAWRAGSRGRWGARGDRRAYEITGQQSALRRPDTHGSRSRLARIIAILSLKRRLL